MNCKPGDMAVIVHPLGAGKLVEVLRQAPPGDLQFPDGVPAFNAYIGADAVWLIHSLGAPFPLEWGHRMPYSSKYGMCRDCWLRPLRGEPEHVDREETCEI